MLLHGGAGLRSCRAAADPGVRDVGSRHRNERLDVPGSEVGRCLPARSRQDAVGRGTRRSRQVLPLRGPRRRCDHLPHPARSESERRLFHPRVGPQSVWCVHRGLGRISGGARPAEAQVLDRRALRAQARNHRQGRQQDRHREHRQLRRRGARGDRRARPAEDRGGLHAHQGLSLRPRRRKLPEPARNHLRGGAESRCAAALAADARDRGGQVKAQIHPELLGISDVL